MKKLFVSILAITSLVACTKEEIVKEQSPFEIKYEGAYVENVTRAAVDPSTTTATIAGFNAYGFMDEPSGIVFNAEDVTKVGSGWSYANTQYWMPGHTYYFAALAPMDSKNWKLTATGNNKLGAGVVEFTNVDGTEDLLYAATTVTTPAEITAQPDAVKFAFNHLLSKVKFTFTNGFRTDNMSVIVSDVKMTAPKSGSIDLDVENWWDNNGDWQLNQETVELAFGNVEELSDGASAEVANERLTIPAAADQVYDITFKVTVKVGDVIAIKEEVRTATVSGVALEMGKAYNFQATLTHSNVFDDVTLYPITFEVTEVKEWVNADTPDENVQEAELFAAAQLGGSVKLVKDMELSKPLIVASNFNLDLNGFTLRAGKPYVAGLTGADISSIVVDGGNLTISGNGKVEGAEYGVYAKKGALTIEGGEYVGITTAVQVAEATVVINGGKFSVTSSDKRYVINCIDANYKNGTAVVSVMGGTFADFNPADNAAEGAKTNFVPLGYASKADGANFVVAAAPVKVEGNVDFKGQTLEVTYAPENTASTYGVVCPEGNTTIENVTINGNGFQTTNGKGLRAIYITKGGEYVFDNVTALNVTYALNVNTTEDVTLTVKNSTLQGWTSYGTSTTASFENVKFTCGKYANFKPYSEVTLTGCDFADGFQLDVTSLASGKIYLNNCTYKGVAISAANMPAIDGDASKVVIVI